MGTLSGKSEHSFSSTLRGLTAFPYDQHKNPYVLMSVRSSIENLNQHLSESFSEASLPPDWKSEWLEETAQNPRAPSLTGVEQVLISEEHFEEELAPNKFTSDGSDAPPTASVDPPGPPPAPDFPEGFPGAPISSSSSRRPPADAYAFYLPFHLYWNRGWGIYLITERYEKLAEEFFQTAKPALTKKEAYAATRLYLYEHAFFHHKVEAFSSRLETVTRERVYLKGQRDLYAARKDTGQQLEEVLAEAYALRRVEGRLRSYEWDWPKKKREAFRDVLVQFMNVSGPPYERGPQVHEEDRFEPIRNSLSEEILSWSPVRAVGKPEAIWSMFGHGFRGLADVSSDVKYLVREGSPVSQRDGLELEPA